MTRVAVLPGVLATQPKGRPVLRLLADDLTGALDTAAELSALCGPVPIRWDIGEAGRGSAAFASLTREAPRAEAAAHRAASMAPALAGADIAFKKLDSLLRGHVAAELAALWRTGAWRNCVLAPAFPAQRRIARSGRVWAGTPGGDWAPVTMPDWTAAGLELRAGSPDEPLPEGITWFDAEDEAEMARIAARGRAAAGPVLWCGSGGLARALAGDQTVRADLLLEAPVLGLFGSDQAATFRQLAACDHAWLRLGKGEDASRLRHALEAKGVALTSLDLPSGLDRDAASRAIAGGFAAILRDLPRPGTLLVAGGETLLAIAEALGAHGLVATGAVAPGVPRSRLQGGAWDGLTVISKSGAFGGDALWRDLLAANDLLLRGTEDT
ncbi:four-carbon acid sugar kinase family protein [Sabulicella rubraurantiaca]|uniref:four-carbon acid sugar kinase family protein n=1 Tax=Sabulicella rubraurantiaca TaxID=2811429 RepID=UPI001A967692|nr:four-carbon acid sugar kinase family protein [Sabulicella rubraurantiaca]